MKHGESPRPGTFHAARAAKRSRCPEASGENSGRRQNTPLFSVIIPTFNREGPLKKAVKSVLDQRAENWELIVVRDGEPGQRDVLPFDQRVRRIDAGALRGAPACRNIGIKASFGAWIAYLDDDDEWLPHHLSVQGPALEDFDFIYSRARLFKEGELSEWHGEPFSRMKLAERNFITSSAVLHRRELIEKAGFWNESATCLQDWELWCRMLEGPARVCFRDAVTVTQNWSSDSITTRSAASGQRAKARRKIQLRYFVSLVLRHLLTKGSKR